jgi:hypothetical protein
MFVSIMLRIGLVTFFVLGVLAFIVGLAQAILGTGGLTSTTLSWGGNTFATNTPAFVLMVLGPIVAFGPLLIVMWIYRKRIGRLMDKGELIVQ